MKKTNLLKKLSAPLLASLITIGCGSNGDGYKDISSETRGDTTVVKATDTRNDQRVAVKYWKVPFVSNGDTLYRSEIEEYADTDGDGYANTKATGYTSFNGIERSRNDKKDISDKAIKIENL